MKIEPTRAAANAAGRGSFPAQYTAAAVPTKTGAIAAGRVLGLAAITQILISTACSASRPLSAAARQLGDARKDSDCDARLSVLRTRLRSPLLLRATSPSSKPPGVLTGRG